MFESDNISVLEDVWWWNAEKSPPPPPPLQSQNVFLQLSVSNESTQAHVLQCRSLGDYADFKEIEHNRYHWPKNPICHCKSLKHVPSRECTLLPPRLCLHWLALWQRHLKEFVHLCGLGWRLHLLQWWRNNTLLCFHDQCTLLFHVHKQTDYFCEFVHFRGRQLFWKSIL